MLSVKFLEGLDNCNTNVLPRKSAEDALNEAQEAVALGGGHLLLVQAPQARRSVDPSNKKIFSSIKGKSY